MLMISMGLRAFRGLVVALPAAGCALTLAAGWPGGISPDMACTIGEGLSFGFYGTQASMFSLVWAMPLALMPLPVVIATFFVLQTCAYCSRSPCLAWVRSSEGGRRSPSSRR